MTNAVRERDRSPTLRPLPVAEAVTQAFRHLERGENEVALQLLEKAVKQAPHVPVIRYLLGAAQSRQKLHALAVSNLEKAVRAEEANLDYLVALGEAMMAERPRDAIVKLTCAVDRGTKLPQAYSQLASLLIDSNKPDEALRICDLGLSLCGDDPAILGNRGQALSDLARYPEAVEYLVKADALRPADITTTINLAGVLLKMGRLRESRSLLERACALDPASAPAHYNLGVALLMAGNYREGFREYEHRWGIQQLVGKRRKFPKPLWDGSELAGRRVLLHAEQGIGDTIQFVRYAEFVRKRAGRVILLAPAPVARLLSWLPDCEIAALDRPLPDFEVHCPLLSLPCLAGTDRDTIPPPAQFTIPVEMNRKWSAKLGEKKGIRVGLVWAGSSVHRNDRNRSFACSLFTPLSDTPNVEWFSLQVGPPAVQLATSGLHDKVRDLAPDLTDYAETAAAISQFDLVITADTSVAHLAASLSTPTWMLVPFAPDWRWLLDRDDSPWYPGMRLFRQPVVGDWDSVMQSVAAALRNLTNPGAPAIHSAAPQTDLARWSNAANLDPAWNQRARLAADFIPAGAHVLDLGCGRMALEGFLPPGCRYTPCDVVRRDERTLLCNFNEQPIPQAAGVTHVTALGVLEYIHDWRGFLRQLRALCLPVVFSYCPTDFTAHLDRKALGWINHLSLQELSDGFAEAGFHLQSSSRPDSNQALLRITPAETKLPVSRRVLVMSYNNVGNFGDRLGFHTINSLLPAGAEVHHGHFQPWNVPPGDFDMLVLGIGNSIFHPILTDQLTELVRRIPRSVGIFGTQYRDRIDTRRMSDLIDRLTVWFARYEEDLLLYGKGRQNAIHLGDWLIGAFPMTQWKRDETLHVGREVWNNLPLDRTIQEIQQFRTVVSERLHPLLCALTSAERVAYQEQREDASGKDSGRFRSLLIDVFGRTFPESGIFEVQRDAVAAYRARSMRVMSGMPELFNQLLGITR